MKSYSEQMEEQLEPRPQRDPADDGPEIELIRKLKPVPSNVGANLRQVADVYLTVGSAYLIFTKAHRCE